MTEIIRATSPTRVSHESHPGFCSPEKAIDHARSIRETIDEDESYRQLIGTKIVDAWWSKDQLHVALSCSRSIVFYVLQDRVAWRYEKYVMPRNRLLDAAPRASIQVKYKEFATRLWSPYEILRNYIGQEFVGIYADEGYAALKIERRPVLIINVYIDVEDKHPFLYWQEDRS